MTHVAHPRDREASRHIAFPSIEGFDAVFRRETRDAPASRRTVRLGAKIKLHGANMAVRVAPDGIVTAQSRKHDLSRDADSFAFASFVHAHRTDWAAAAADTVVTFYGEWAGPGINKGDAIQKTDRKRFFLFAVGLGAAPHPLDARKLRPAEMITDPDAIRALMPDLGTGRLEDVHVLPWHAHHDFDFADEAAVEATLAALNAAVARVAETDPFVAETFGVAAPGEGFVLAPDSAERPVSGDAYARLAFKAKTEKHRVRKQGRPASAREPLPASAADFVETFATARRVAQAIEETCAGAPPDVSRTGQVIGWVIDDIRKEAGAEIAALGLPFARLKGPIADAARAHFMDAIGR